MIPLAWAAVGEPGGHAWQVWGCPWLCHQGGKDGVVFGDQGSPVGGVQGPEGVGGVDRGAEGGWVIGGFQEGVEGGVPPGIWGLCLSGGGLPGLSGWGGLISQCGRRHCRWWRVLSITLKIVGQTKRTSYEPCVRA